VHDLVAHLAAGATENADLIEDAMPDEQLRQELVSQFGRKVAAVEALAARGADGRINSPVAFLRRPGSNRRSQRSRDSPLGHHR
jgi:hypothetical protein